VRTPKADDQKASAVPAATKTPRNLPSGTLSPLIRFPAARKIEGNDMKVGPVLTAAAIAALTACNSNNNANNAAATNVATNAATNLNAAATMNATEMNATDLNATTNSGVTDVNATGNTAANATSNH
jgi:hypothetical protein